MGGTYYTSASELACLGLQPGDYTGANLWNGWSHSILDDAAKLHVAARGTLSWAIYVYSGDISGPFDTDHERLYFGSTEIDFSYVIDGYQPGTNWSYEVSSIDVSGENGSFVLESRDAPAPLLALNFSATKAGPADIGGGIGYPGCTSN